MHFVKQGLVALGSLLLALAATAAARAQGEGTLVQAQPIAGAPEGAAAYLIRYRSLGLRGEPLEVSGMAVVPRGAPPPAGRPIIAWAHPTTGVVPRCAPSLSPFRFQMMQGLRNMVQRGYAIVATDYPGLGTPETHPYLVGTSEARAVLDSVRAAHALPGVGNERRFAVWGHSQGGQAALFTGLLARGYAPDLDLVGVAAAAPATELAVLLKADLDTFGGRNLTAMTLWSWGRVYGAPIYKVLDPAAVPVVDRLAQSCLDSIPDLLSRKRLTTPLETRFLRVQNFADAEPWASLLAQNTPGALPPDIPIFLAQGTADKLVLPQVTQNYRARLCAAGSAVAFDLMPGVSHGGAAARSALAAVAWMTDRFAGRPAPSNCGVR